MKLRIPTRKDSGKKQKTEPSQKVKTWSNAYRYIYTVNGATITATRSDAARWQPDDNRPHSVSLSLHEPEAGSTDVTLDSEELSLFNRMTGSAVSEKEIRYHGRGNTSYSESGTAPAGAGTYTALLTISGITTGEGMNKNVTAVLEYELSGTERKATAAAEEQKPEDQAAEEYAEEPGYWEPAEEEAEPEDRTAEEYAEEPEYWEPAEEEAEPEDQAAEESTEEPGYWEPAEEEAEPEDLAAEAIPEEPEFEEPAEEEPEPEDRTEEEIPEAPESEEPAEEEPEPEDRKAEELPEEPENEEAVEEKPKPVTRTEAVFWDIPEDEETAEEGPESEELPDEAPLDEAEDEEAAEEEPESEELPDGAPWEEAEAEEAAGDAGKLWDEEDTEFPEGPGTEEEPEPEAETESWGFIIPRMEARGKRKLTAVWEPVEDADGYDVFFARCGTDFDGIYMTRSAEKTGCSIRGLEKKTLYKLRVLAFAMRGGEKEYIGEAFTARCMTGGGNKKHTNAKEIRIRADRIELNVGEKQKIKAKVIGEDPEKRVLAHREPVKFLSDDPGVVKVKKDGKLKGVGAGNCRVLLVADTGVSSFVEVTVSPGMDELFSDWD